MAVFSKKKIILFSILFFLGLFFILVDSAAAWCYDSDYGENYFYAGYCYDSYYDDTYYDHCTYNHAVDYFCTEGYCDVDTKNCNDYDATTEYCSGNLIMSDLEDFYCSGGLCDSITYTSTIKNCDDDDGWYTVSFYYGCVGDFLYLYNYQEYQDWSCLDALCYVEVTNWQTVSQLFDICEDAWFNEGDPYRYCTENYMCSYQNQRLYWGVCTILGCSSEWSNTTQIVQIPGSCTYCPNCTLDTCASLGAECGTNIDDGCGGTIDCGGCGPCGVCSAGTCSAISPDPCSGCQTCQEVASNDYRCQDDSNQCPPCQVCESGVCNMPEYDESGKELKIIKDGRVLAGIDSNGIMIIQRFLRSGSPPNGFKIKGSSSVTADSVTINPNAVGDSSVWDVVGATYNYQAVSGSGYVKGTNGQTDLYHMQTSGVLAGKTINNVKVYFRCRINYGEPRVKAIVKSGGSVSERSLKTLGASYQLFSSTFSSKPGGGAWTKSAIDSLQVGIVAAGPAPPPNGNGRNGRNGRPPVIKSLVAGTKVLMADGKYKNIEDIQVGDLVTSFDVETWEFKQALVSKKTTGSKPYLEINKVLKVSLTHPVYVVGKGFIPARDIIIGDRLINEQGEEAVVESLNSVDEKVAVHDIVLDSFQTFFADEYLVHNAVHEARCTQVYAVVNYTETITTISGIDSKGNLWLPGTLYENSTLVPTGKKELIVKGELGNLAMFDDSGNLYLRCGLIENGWGIPDSTSWELPTSASMTVFYGGQAPWTNYNNITQESNYAVSEITTGASWEMSGELHAFDFPFNLHADAKKITGIEVQISHKASIWSSISDYFVNLTYYGERRDSNRAKRYRDAFWNILYWSTSQETFTYGGPGDMWNPFGLTYSVDEIRDQHIGLSLFVRNLHQGSTDSAYVYWIKMKIYYDR